MAQIENHIAEERDLLRVTLASIGDAVITTDTQGRITFMNPVAQAVTGWALADATGVRLDGVFQIIHEVTRRPVENPVVVALREGTIVGLANHTLLIAKDGTERPIDDSAAPIRNAEGQISGAVLVFRDVTERRNTERALGESEKRFRLLVSGVKDYAIFMLDPNGIISSWNAGAEKIKGYSANEIIGKHFSCFYPSETVAAGIPDEELRRAVAEGRFEDEGWRLRNDGSKFWANVLITPIWGETGRLKGFTKVTRDLTERRQLEQARIESEVLANLNRRKDEFLAMVSHELRNPLAPILNAVHLLQLKGDDNLIRQDTIRIIERQVGQLKSLVDHLLDVSRIAMGRIRLQQECVDGRVIAERAIESVHSLVARKKHDLSVALPDQPVWLCVDAARIEDILVNLLTNAAKYTNEGGRIWLAIAQQGNEAEFRVRDTGVGIEPELLPRVFELFTQADNSLHRADGGLGIGLSIVQRIVEMHAGRVEALSAGVGRGSEFVVHLPLFLKPPTSPQSPSATTDDRRTARFRILIVDDNKDSADTAAMLLRHYGHTVLATYSSKAALEEATAFRPEVVLLDIGLPQMDGYEVARRLRQTKETHNAWIVAVTGFGQEEDRERSRAAGFDAHLVKPVTSQAMEDALRALKH